MTTTSITKRSSTTGAVDNGRQSWVRNLDARTERVRRLLVSSLPHGTKLTLAGHLGISASQLSRQLNGVEGLTLRTVLAACRYLEPGDAVALWSVIASHVPPAVQEHRITLFRLADGNFVGLEGH